MKTATGHAVAAGNGVAAAGVQFLSPTVPMVFLGLGYNYRALAEHEGALQEAYVPRLTTMEYERLRQGDPREVLSAMEIVARAVLTAI